MRRRYLALKAESGSSFSQRDVMNAIWDMIYQLFGECGASQTALSHVKSARADEKDVVIIRCSHIALDMVRAAIAAITEICKEQAVVRVAAVSGTLKALRRKLHERI